MTANTEYADKPGYDAEGYPVRSVGNGLLSHHWAGPGVTGAPDASAMRDYTIGATLNAVSTAATYHVIDGAWVPTGGTVANLYGAA